MFTLTSIYIEPEPIHGALIDWEKGKYEAYNPVKREWLRASVTFFTSLRRGRVTDPNAVVIGGEWCLIDED